MFTFSHMPSMVFVKQIKGEFFPTELFAKRLPEQNMGVSKLLSLRKLVRLALLFLLRRHKSGANQMAPNLLKSAENPIISEDYNLFWTFLNIFRLILCFLTGCGSNIEAWNQNMSKPKCSNHQIWEFWHKNDWPAFERKTKI